VEVGGQVVEVLLVHGVAHGGHEVAAVDDGVEDAVVVGGGAAGEEGLFVEAEEGGAVEVAGAAVVVADGATGFEDGVAVGLLGSEAFKRRRRWGALAADGEGEGQEGGYAQWEAHGIIFSDSRPAGRARCARGGHFVPCDPLRGGASVGREGIRADQREGCAKQSHTTKWSPSAQDARPAGHLFRDPTIFLFSYSAAAMASTILSMVVRSALEEGVWVLTRMEMMTVRPLAHWR